MILPSLFVMLLPPNLLCSVLAFHPQAPISFSPSFINARRTSLGSGSAFFHKQQQQQRHVRQSHLLASSSKHSNTYGDDDLSTGVHVWDNVLSPSTCDTLHDYATSPTHDSSCRPRSSIFYRHTTNDNDTDDIAPRMTLLEQTMDSILSEIEDKEDGDEQQQPMVVEYWHRSEFMNINVHADVDETQALEDRVLRYPTNGHVLYLQLGDKVKAGPTVVFERGNKSGSGWGGDEEEEEVVEMVTVPCVPGRLLRFEGGMMHGVPRPADWWLLRDDDDVEDGNADEYDEHNDEDDDDDDDYYDEEEDEDEDEWGRSVLIFNTWPYDAPPRGVNPDPETGVLPMGMEVEVSEEEMRSIISSTRKRNLRRTRGVVHAMSNG